MKDRNELTRDGEPLVDRGTIPSQAEEEEDREPPIDETDNGPQPVIRKGEAAKPPQQPEP